MQRLRVGDMVQVISGKDRNKQGRIIKILRDEDKVIVEGINVVSCHQRSRDRSQAGEIVKKPAPIAASKVMPLDPETGKPTRVHFEVRDGQKVRVAKSGAVIPAEARLGHGTATNHTHSEALLGRGYSVASQAIQLPKPNATASSLKDCVEHGFG